MSSRLSVNSSNHSGRSANGAPEFFLSSLFFYLCFVFLEGSHLFQGATSSLRSNTGPEDELEADRRLFPEALSTSFLDESCGGDVEDENASRIGG